MDVSIIIVNYRSAGLVIDCIRSVFEKSTGVSYEIIVVDNASGDDSIEQLRRHFQRRIQTIESEVNLGFGKANNLGAKMATGKYVFLLNPDTILINNAVKILHDELETHRDYGIVGGNLYTADRKPAPSFCSFFDDLQKERKEASWNSLVFGKVRQKLDSRRSDAHRPDFNYTEQPMEVAYIFGADIMLSKELYDECGGFDPDFFMYAEEEELTWRIHNKGCKVVSIPQAQIIHLDGATTKKNDEFSERQFKMRMTGTMTYYTKRYGESGAAEFYRLRSRRYRRLCQIAKLQGKLSDSFVPAIQLRCLREAYKAYTERV